MFLCTFLALFIKKGIPRILIKPYCKKFAINIFFNWPQVLHCSPPQSPRASFWDHSIQGQESICFVRNLIAIQLWLLILVPQPTWAPCQQAALRWVDFSIEQSTWPLNTKVSKSKAGEVMWSIELQTGSMCSSPKQECTVFVMPLMGSRNAKHPQISKKSIGATDTWNIWGSLLWPLTSTNA